MSTPVPPPQAVSAGFSALSFDQEPGQWDIGFGPGAHKWSANLWWKPVPPTSSYSVDSSGFLTITDQGKPSVGTDICTQFHDLTGGTYFKGGYFEAYIFATDWSAFWLFCAHRPWVYGSAVLPNDPLTWTNEIDIIETDPGPAFVNTVVTTLHQNSSGDGGVPDAQNSNNNNTITNGPVTGAWHVYGCLWTQTQVTWYVDNVAVCTTNPFASTWQPAQLILSAAAGGVNNSPSNVHPPITKVQWVRVWTAIPPGPNTSLTVALTPQTGMPPIYHSRSRELNYDVLITQPNFMPNPFGPQILSVSRPEHHW